jgi:tetratricopeptide (TPR) repeat protein
MNDDKKTRIASLLIELIEEDDDDRRVELADAILEIEPGSAVAKYLKWQSLGDDDSEEGMKLLASAVETLRPLADAPPEEDDEDLISGMFVSMLSDLAFYLYATGDFDGAFAAASEFIKRDTEYGVVGRVVYYASLVKRGEFAAVMEGVASDICETSIGELFRALAAFETSGFSRDAAGYLLKAFELDPDLMFYVLEIWSIDEEDIDHDEDDFLIEEMIMSVTVLTELWSATDERLAFISAVAFTLGYMTGRLESSEDVALLEESYRDAGGLGEINEARDTLHAKLAAGHEQEIIDAQALAIFRDADYFGLIG